MNDIDRAAAAWGEADDRLWIFAELAAPIVGRRDGGTAELATLIGRSVDLVESYAAAFSLFRTGSEYPSASQVIEVCREDLKIGHWVAVARKWRADILTLDDALNYLARARQEHLTVEALRSCLPAVDGRGDWMRSALKLKDRVMRELVDAPRLNVDERGAAKVARAARLLAARIEMME